jgi:hypothetical protein
MKAFLAFAVLFNVAANHIVQEGVLHKSDYEGSKHLSGLDTQRLWDKYKEEPVNLLARDRKGFTTIDYLVTAFQTESSEANVVCRGFNCFTDSFNIKPIEPCLSQVDLHSIDHKRAEMVLYSYANSMEENSHYSLNCSNVKKFLSSNKKLDFISYSSLSCKSRFSNFISTTFGDNDCYRNHEQEIHKMKEGSFEF